MKRMLTTGITALGMAMTVACGDVEINAPDWPDWTQPRDSAGAVRVPWDWSGPVPPGQHIEIKGVAGDIRAVAASGSNVVVTATKIGRPNDVAAVKIEVVPHALGVTICAVYPDVAGHPPNACEPGDGGNMSVWDGGAHHVAVEFSIEVPAGVALAGRTLSGDVVATRLGSDVFASTMAGNIQVSTTRLATAKTMRGSIVVSIGLSNWDRDLEFSTMTGDVSVTVPATANARVQATAPSGGITSDFPLTHGLPGEMHGTIGSGGPTLTLTTLAGDVALKRKG